VLAYVVTRHSYHLLPLFLSASFAHAAVMGQWSLILTAALLIPWLAFLGAAKPTVGVAMLGASLSWRAAAAMVAIAVFSLALMPTWPKEWLAQLPSSPYHFSPLRTPIGFLTLAALARWRRPEARLLAVLGVVPQSPFVYEVLPLFLIPRTRFQSYALVIGSDLALGVYLYTRGMETAAFYRYNGLAIVIALYLPALWMILRCLGGSNARAPYCHRGCGADRRRPTPWRGDTSRGGANAASAADRGDCRAVGCRARLRIHDATRLLP